MAISALKNSLNKNDQLIAMLKKPNGTRVSLIGEKLDWQAHTVRAAISGLRKRGFEVSRTRAKKSGEAVYAIIGDKSIKTPEALNAETVYTIMADSGAPALKASGKDMA